MKQLMFILVLLFAISTVVLAQNNPTQLQQAQNEIIKWKMLYEVECEKVKSLIIQNSKLNDHITDLGKFVEKTNKVLNDAYGKDKKIHPLLLNMGYKYIALPDTSKKPADSKLSK